MLYPIINNEADLQAAMTRRRDQELGAEEIVHFTSESYRMREYKALHQPKQIPEFERRFRGTLSAGSKKSETGWCYIQETDPWLSLTCAAIFL